MTSNSAPTSLRPLVRIRVNGEVKTADVLASCKVAGHTFLIHRADHNPSFYRATYAPVGLSGRDAFSIDEAISDLQKVADNIHGTIQRAIEGMWYDYFPLLSSEEGFELNDWEWREQQRFASGEYQSLPELGLTYPHEHYVHLSIDKVETDFVAYTPSVAYGERDRQVRLKFGKYLRKVFPDLSDADIQELVSKFKAKLALAEQPRSLHFATDRETINEIFETPMCAWGGSSVSCMHGKFDGDKIRPYHVYADSPDVAVAFLRDQGDIVARSVVSTKHKSYVRIYARHGDSELCEMLREELKRNGYNCPRSLEGNRLTKLPTEEPMLPYLDGGCQTVRDAGKYWIVDEDGEYAADCVDGSASCSTPQCETCENDQDNCECYVCGCCDNRTYPDSCDNCSFCENCDGCREHDGCDCEVCTRCGDVVNPSRRHVASCDCARCSECNELERDCECDKCDECQRLTTECECEPEEVEEEAATCAQS